LLYSSVILIFLLTTRRVPGYPKSYPVGYPGNELPDNGSSKRKPHQMCYASEFLNRPNTKWPVCSGVAMGWAGYAKSRGPPSKGAPEFQANFQRIIFLLQ